MVQKKIAASEPGAKPKRGRPRAYEPDVALGKALDVFRKDGYAATSLDDLSAATGMNRPSLYGAFGDKRELYIKTYQRYRADGRAALTEIFSTPMPLRTRLQDIFGKALEMYLSGEDGPRGCFTVMSAASDAIADPDIRALVVGGLRELDKAFTSCFRSARETGELPPTADPATLAQMASATLHTLSVRARAGASRLELEPLMRASVDLLCGPAR